MSITVDQILDQAAQLIDRAPGLAKGTFRTGDGDQVCYCILGAIHAAACEALPHISYPQPGWEEREIARLQVESNAVRATAAQLVSIDYPDTKNSESGRVSAWNDRLSTTKQDAVAILRAAALARRGDRGSK
ncbi:DUF6197 family protein [Nocardia transvalensis]|uniref:DUF6197 family protein n=1 Tax=Nocardia transvalensis TaxID=37333 RepID=UPI00189477F6|nr:hypothetical protein [Nocardia transvalensis]MBF6332445.1 hypothetical protein [Nocardia transvalensis]